MNRGFFGISSELRNLQVGSQQPWLAIGDGSVYVGDQACPLPAQTSADSVTTGSGSGRWNVHIGYQAGSTNASGDSNVIIGWNAGAFMVGSSRCTFVGYRTGVSVTSGTDNTFIGSSAGSSCTSGNSSVAVGVNAGQNATSGNYNVFVGASAGLNASSSTQNVYVGYQSGTGATGSSNTFMGFQSGAHTTTGANQVAVGFGAGPTAGNGTSASSVNIGALSTTTAASTTAVGASTSTTAGYAGAVGANASASASGAWAVGTDSSGIGASTSTANEIKVGTTNHTVNVLGKSKIGAHNITSGALPTTTLSSGTAAQIDTTSDRMAVTAVTFSPTAGAAGTCAVALSADNVTYSTLTTLSFPATVTLDGTVLAVSAMVPAGWYLKLTATNATIGITTYF